MFFEEGVDEHEREERINSKELLRACACSVAEFSIECLAEANKHLRSVMFGRTVQFAQQMHGVCVGQCSDLFLTAFLAIFGHLFVEFVESLVRIRAGSVGRLVRVVGAVLVRARR